MTLHNLEPDAVVATPLIPIVDMLPYNSDTPSLSDIEIRVASNVSPNSSGISSPIPNNIATPTTSEAKNSGEANEVQVSDFSNIADTKFSNANDKGKIDQINSVTDPPGVSINEGVGNTVNDITLLNLNINSLANKFDALTVMIKDKIYILVLVETKLGNTFPENQFCIEGFGKPYRFDRNRNGGGVMVYVRKDIPSKELKKHTFPKNIEAIFLEINLRKSKLLLVGTYHSTHLLYGTSDKDFFQEMGLALDVYSNYDKFLLAGDFNVQEEENSLQEFLDDFSANNLVKEKTCFKSLENPSCIDLFITYSYQNFQNTVTISTGLSDFHCMVVTVLKTTFPKAKPKIVNENIYRFSILVLSTAMDVLFEEN